ncbi:MAG: nuclear transport factor 2 family protein [bacterium]
MLKHEKFSEKWLKAYESRDRDALEDLIDDEFVYIRHQSGKEIAKEEMLNIWSAEGPRPQRRSYRVIYENEDIVVSHQFIDFPSGDIEAVMVVILLSNGKAIRMETGATPMPS